jgi:eukaryotic-like serine/threonine-protein kinase
MNLEIGTTVGDYQVVGILGAGGMGQVYKVRNVISDRVEAMKVLLPDLANQPDLADRFLREIKVQASLVHPNIAGLHTAVRVDNQLLMLMEFVEGVTLDQKLKDGPLPAAEAVNYVMQVLAALDYAHAHGVVHRDIKPGNMMLTSGGVVKLMDFGIARSATDHKLTQTGTTVGSLYYMSPEQIQGVAAPDARSDLYSVGVSLYELVTGKKPFDGDSQFAIMSAHLAGTPVPPVTVDPRLPKMLNDVILMSVAKDAAARFQTATALRNALANVAAGLQPTVALPAPAPAAAKAPPQPAKAAVPGQPVSHRGAWMGLGAVAAVLAIVAVIALAPWKKTGAAPAKADAPMTQPQPQLPVSEPAAPVATQPEPQPQLPAAAASSPVSTPGNASPRVPSRTPGMARPAPAASHSAGQAQQPAEQQPVQQQPTAQQAVQEQPTQHQPSAPAGPSRAELQEVRESIALIGVRASGIRTSLQTLQNAQGKKGLNLRGDMQSAANLMDTYLDGAQAALNAGDVTQARSFLDKAEPQVQKLEKFLNR